MQFYNSFFIENFEFLAFAYGFICLMLTFMKFFYFVCLTLTLKRNDFIELV